MAQDRFTGCYAGVGGGYSMALTDTSVGVPGFGVGVDGLGAQGASIAGLAGCDLKVAPRLVLGVWGDFTHDPDTTFAVTVTGAPTILETSLENRWGLGGRLGWLVTPRAMAYVLAGYTQAETSDITSPAFPAVSIAVPDLKGYVVGGGAEFDLDYGFFLQVQGTYADYRDENISLGGPVSLGLDTDVLTARVALTYKLNFGSDLSGTPAFPPIK